MTLIQLVDSICNIDGADNIQLANVLGWKCVIKKGKFKPKDKAIYFEIDSLLPIDMPFEFLRKSCFHMIAIIIIILCLTAKL